MKNVLVLSLAAAALLFSGTLSGVQSQELYEVTITNLTAGQVITPPIVVSHVPGGRLFTLGKAARPELVKLAEDGDTSALEALLTRVTAVGDVAVATEALPPGGSVKVEVAGDGAHSALTAAAMLASTNDAFAALRNIPLPAGTSTHYAVAYDAGSEANTESCASIPGPPCGNATVRNTMGAEGYVHVHPGIHGIADLDPALHDWRNPVAAVTIRHLP